MVEGVFSGVLFETSCCAMAMFRELCSGGPRPSVKILAFGGAGVSPVLTRAAGTIVLVRALSRSQAHRFSEASFAFRARRKTFSHSHGRKTTWRAKRTA